MALSSFQETRCGGGQIALSSAYKYTLQRSNVAPLWSIISICSWVYIHHVRYHLKTYLSFHWYFICHDCFAETCTGRLSWVQCQKINVAKLDQNFNQWYQFVYEIIFLVLGIIWKPIYFSLNWYIICYDCLSGFRNMRKVIILDPMSKNKCSKIASLFEIQHDVLFRRILVQWMGPGAVGTSAYAHRRKAWNKT